MLHELKTKLLELCRNELQITWTDEEIDKRIENHITNGIAHIGRITNAVDYDFAAGGKANALLLAYVRRAMNGDTSTFDADYREELIALNYDNEVDVYGDEV